MPETLSFLEWNSVGFYLPENFSMSLVFCSANPHVCVGSLFLFGNLHVNCRNIEFCCRWNWPEAAASGLSARYRRENKGSVFNKRASEQFLGSDCCCAIPHLLLLWLKFMDTKWNFLILLCNALLVTDCEIGLRKYEVNLKRWSSFRAFLSCMCTIE